MVGMPTMSSTKCPLRRFLRRLIMLTMSMIQLIILIMSIIRPIMLIPMLRMLTITPQKALKDTLKNHV